MFFYSEGPGYLDTNATSSMTTTGSASTVSLVGYRVNSANPYYPGVPVMERLGENLTWAGPGYPPTSTIPGGMVFLPLTLAGNWAATLGTAPYLSGSTEHYQVLSDMVFRMEFCFLLKSGTYTIPGAVAMTGTTGYSNAPTAIPTSVPQPYVTSSSLPDPSGNVYGFPPDLGGVVVTIAVLDDTSRKLTNAGGVATLAAALSDSLPNNNTVGSVQTSPPAELTAQMWRNQIVQNGFSHSVGIPQIALTQLRIYERTFYLSAN
jgi:hypothetical protein